METIGLVTFTNALDNYGQVLQAYATQEFLKQRGHRVFLLRQTMSEYKRLEVHFRMMIKWCFWFLSRNRRLKTSLDAYRDIQKKMATIQREDKLHPRNFEEFRQGHFSITNNSRNSLRKKKISVLCAGGDQIWSGMNPFYFLDFGPSGIKKISISSSNGGKTKSHKEKAFVKKWLTNFSLITVREQSGVEMCEGIGLFSAKVVLDPTFLLSAADYNMIASKREDETHDFRYLFVYLLEAETDVTYEDIKAFAEENNLIIKYVTSTGRSDNHEKIYADIPEWLGLLRDATYIITNSFHGMAISIIYRKKFLVLPRIGKTSDMNNRIYELAQKTNLNERIYSSDLSVVKDDIDYSKAEIIINDNRLFLRDLLSGVGI